jgi:hypothetical protein
MMPGRPTGPGEKARYKDIDLHAGLVCLNGPAGMVLDLQKELFGANTRLNRVIAASLDVTDRSSVAAADSRSQLLFKPRY